MYDNNIIINYSLLPVVIKIFAIHLKFKFDWASCIISGTLTWSKLSQPPQLIENRRLRGLCLPIYWRRLVNCQRAKVLIELEGILKLENTPVTQRWHVTTQEANNADKAWFLKYMVPHVRLWVWTVSLRPKSSSFHITDMWSKHGPRERRDCETVWHGSRC